MLAPLTNCRESHLLWDLDEPRAQKVVTGRVSLDCPHLVLEVVWGQPSQSKGVSSIRHTSSRSVQVDIVKLEPALPEPFGKP